MSRDYAFEAAHGAWEMRELDRHLDEQDDDEFLEARGWKEVGKRKSGEIVWKKGHYGETLIKTTNEAVAWEEA